MSFPLLFSPALSSIGLIEYPFQEAAQAYLNWSNDILRPYEMHLTQSLIDLEPDKIESRLQPRTNQVRSRFLFLETRSLWTVFLDNSTQGTDGMSPMRHLTRLLGVKAMRVVCKQKTSPDDVQYESGWANSARILELYDNGSTVRSIYCIEDTGKWQFDQNGVPFEFEDLTAYKSRRIRDRFTPEMLAEYLKHLDARPYDPDWYTGRAVFLQKHGRYVSE